MGPLSLFVFSLWLLWLFYRDEKERASVSSATWIVLIWAAIHSTRPVTSWFSGMEPEAFGWESRDEGNPIGALIDIILIVVGLVVLRSRSIRWPAVIRDNPWMTVFYLFWAMSIFWSDYPFITFKRVIRDLGNVVMVLMVLAELEPGEAVKAVCTRLAYASIPLSILLYRYFPEWGRVYAGYNSDTQMFVGVATHKNTLGVLAMVGALFLLWDLFDFRTKAKGVAGKISFVSSTLVLLMSWYLLLIIDSVTSLICTALGSALIIGFRGTSVGRYPRRMEIVGLGSMAIFWMLDSVFNVTEAFVQSLGRDMSLTTRTDIWAIVRDYQDNPLVGSGFNTFWAGQRLVSLAESTGGIIQAHNGYLETYLNGGIIGVCLLGALIITAYWRIRQQLMLNIPEGSIRLVILLVALVHNYSEASFNKTGLLWLLILFAIIQYREQLPLRQTVPVVAQ